MLTYFWQLQNSTDIAYFFLTNNKIYNIICTNTNLKCVCFIKAMI